MSLDENLIVELVRRGVITQTFRRLDPDKKERIYRAALKLFGKFGYDGLSVDEVCHEGSISKGSFFQYFPSKTHLLEFAVLVFDHYLDELVAELRAGDRAARAADRLLYLYRSLAVNSRLYPDEERFYLFVTRALDHAAVSLEGIDLERHFSDYVVEIIERGETSGEIRGDFDSDLTGQLCSLIIAALVRRHYSGRQHRVRETGEYLISFLFDGIKA
ncbi:MAG: TetR/AcrR family transcriptional regulator [bacterium]